MSLNTSELTVAGFVNGAPHGLVLVKREMNGHVTILGAWQGPITATLLNEFLPVATSLYGKTLMGVVSGYYADTVDVDAVVATMKRPSGFGWVKMFKPLAACREILGGVLPQQGDASSRVKADDDISGAGIMRDAIRTGQGPLFDALAVAVAAIESRFPAGGAAKKYRREMSL